MYMYYTWHVEAHINSELSPLPSENIRRNEPIVGIVDLAVVLENSVIALAAVILRFVVISPLSCYSVLVYIAYSGDLFLQLS